MKFGLHNKLSGIQDSSDVVHNELSGLQGGVTDEYYHITASEKTVIENTSGTNTGDQILPTRDSLGLDTDDTVTFANLSGTNTGDQQSSDFIHNNLTSVNDAGQTETKGHINNLAQSIWG